MNEKITKGPEVALLTKSEREWLLDKIKVSKDYEYRIKSDIKRKMQTFEQLELPLLLKKGFFSHMSDLSVYAQSLSAGPQIQNTKRSLILTSFHKLESLGRDLDPGPLPYQCNALPG